MSGLFSSENPSQKFEKIQELINSQKEKLLKLGLPTVLAYFGFFGGIALESNPNNIFIYAILGFRAGGTLEKKMKKNISYQQLLANWKQKNAEHLEYYNENLQELMNDLDEYLKVGLDLVAIPKIEIDDIKIAQTETNEFSVSFSMIGNTMDKQSFLNDIEENTKFINKNISIKFVVNETNPISKENSNVEVSNTQINATITINPKTEPEPKYP